MKVVKDRRIGMLVEKSRFGRIRYFVISLYLLVQKIQTRSLNAPKISKYKVV
jgi:hypothetical protein